MSLFDSYDATDDDDDDDTNIIRVPFSDPVVRFDPWEDAIVLRIDDVEASVEIEFPHIVSFERFRDQIAGIRCTNDKPATGERE